MELTTPDFKSKAKCFTADEFYQLDTVDVRHKENEGVFISSPIKNFHCLARAEYHHNGEGAVIKITADDYYKLYINGVYICQGPAPAYSEKYYYNELDISPYLVKGRNIIAVHLYYQGLVNRVWQSADNRFCLCALVNDENLVWKYKPSYAFCGEVNGYDTDFTEDFDSRLWDNGWCTVNFDDSGWRPMPVKNYDYDFVKQPTALLSVYKIKPEIIRKADNIYFVDTGQELSGGLSLECVGRSGEQIIIRYGEELNDDGTVRYKLRSGCTYQEIWTLDDGRCTFESYFYKGFRYAEIISEYELTDISVICRHYPFDDLHSAVKFSDKRISDIFRLCRNTIKYSTQDGFIDCPTREKGQYLGDAFIAAHSHMILTGRCELAEKCVDDFARSSRVCDGLMAVAPCSLMQEIADYSLIFGELLLTVYRYNKSKDFLAKYYNIAKNVILYFKKYEREDGLLDKVSEKWNLVDWPENMRDNYDFELSRPVVSSGVHNVINAYYIGAVKTLNIIEDILEIERSFDFSALKKAYNNIFFNGRLYVDSEGSSHSSLHSNVFALYFDLAEKENANAIADFIVEKGFSCGVYVSYFAMKALSAVGKKEELFRLLVNDSEHGWLNMLREGATTCFEVWGKEQKSNTSLCHPWATAPISVIMEDLKEYVISCDE